MGINDDDELLASLFHGGIWATPGVDEEPGINLSAWRVLEVVTTKSTVERHFVGYSRETREGRVSSTIQAFEPQTATGVSRSGRVYRLIGPPGIDRDGDYVWRHLSDFKNYSGERDVTAEYVALMNKAGWKTEYWEWAPPDGVR